MEGKLLNAKNASKENSCTEPMCVWPLSGVSVCSSFKTDKVEEGKKSKHVSDVIQSTLFSHVALQHELKTVMWTSSTSSAIFLYL